MSRKKFEIMKKSFGERLKGLRLKRKLKQNQIAIATNILKSTLSELENDKHSPSSAALVQLSEYFNVSSNWLLTGGGEPTKTPHVASHEAEYNQHGNWQPSQELLGSEEWKLIGKTHEIITSDTAYSAALISNINAFYQAMKETNKTNAVQKECADLKARIGAIEKGHTENPTNENIEKKAM